MISKCSKNRFFSNNVAYVLDHVVKHYCLEPPFDPPEVYPELSLVKNTNKNNMIYPMVRTLLQQAGMDKENIGSSRWNPFKDIVKQAANVVIKPNLVTHRHYLGESFLYSSIVHGSVIRPIIDYLNLAMKNDGKIIIADNPVEGADFKELMRFTGIQKMADELVNRKYNEIKVIDLRSKVLKEAKSGNFYNESQVGDPLGYIAIDLGSESMFAEFDKNSDIHYYTLADPTVDHIDPKYQGKSATDDYHNSRSHKYIVSKTILNADVIINVAKMKSHCKSGVTLTLKNMIGMVYQKDCMPHHRPGMPPDGDSFPEYPASHYVIAKKSYLWLRRLLQIHRLPGFRPFRNWLQKNRIMAGQHIEHGNWKGNDTIWRTILDLNRIAVYADKGGKMHNTPQRDYFAFIDGIISQQGEAPMNGEAVPTSIFFAGYNPVMIDAIAIKAMGLDYQLIKSVSKACEISKWPLLIEGNYDLSFSDMKLPNLEFKLTKGWS